jgi:hypothetical protein
MAQTLFAILSKMLLLCGVTILLISPGAHCFQNRKVLDATARADSFSTSTGFQWPSFFSNFPNSAGAQGAAQATVDQGQAGARSESTTNTPDYFLGCICQKPTDPTTAEALSEAFAAGVNSAISKAASKAVAMAGDKCCDNLKTALAKAASFAQSTGKGDAFVSAASKSEAEATSICGQQAIAQSISGSRASNGNASAEGTAQAQASGPNAKTSTQTQSTVGPNSASSSSSSFATSG